MDDVKRARTSTTRWARKRPRRDSAGLHNEGFESSTVDGKRTYDMLFELLDPKLVKFQFQVSEIADGFDAAEYFTKYPGRFISMHVQGWSASEKKIVAVGQGSLDWKKIFKAAKWRDQELFCGDGLSAHEGQRAVLAEVEGVRGAGVSSSRGSGTIVAIQHRVVNRL